MRMLPEVFLKKISSKNNQNYFNLTTVSLVKEFCEGFILWLLLNFEEGKFKDCL